MFRKNWETNSQGLVLPARFGDNRAMPFPVNVAVHPSQFPENVRRDLLESLRRRRVNPKFLYDSLRQTQKWLALHQACSPTRTDPDCAAIYDRSFEAAARHIQARHIHVIGLGCGGGQKDTCLLRLLQSRGAEVFYTPCDVSVSMVLVARHTAIAVVPEQNCFPLVCDLATADDLPAVLSSRRSTSWRVEAERRRLDPRLFTFFGMIPNFEPQMILPKLAALVRQQDGLLFSANLAPGPDYGRGMKRILPQYDNPLTRDWLMTFLLDHGVEKRDGRLRFQIESHGGLKRIVANFQFARSRRLDVDGRKFEMRGGQTLRLFFSYRYTPERVRKVLAGHGLEVEGRWITNSEEEGVFFCRRKGRC